MTNTDSLQVVQRPGKIVFLRGPSATLELRGTYEFYAGTDSTGQRIWSVNASDKMPSTKMPTASVRSRK